MTARIWRPPRLRTAEEREDRHATWLELFFDLVFVAAVAQLASLLSHELTWSGLGKFVFLYAPLWWSWAAIWVVGALAVLTVAQAVADVFAGDLNPVN